MQFRWFCRFRSSYWHRKNDNQVGTLSLESEGDNACLVSVFSSAECKLELPTSDMHIEAAGKSSLSATRYSEASLYEERKSKGSMCTLRRLWILARWYDSEHQISQLTVISSWSPSIQHAFGDVPTVVDHWVTSPLHRLGRQVYGIVSGVSGVNSPPWPISWISTLKYQHGLPTSGIKKWLPVALARWYLLQ